jgi:hypothetical protein
MSNIHRTARGINIDLDRLKTINERTVAVGNAGVNARGDMVRGDKIIKSREEIAQEMYNIRGNNIAKENKVNTPTPDIMPNLDSTSRESSVTENNLGDEARGGLANALNRSQELADRLAAQRKRI